MESGRSTLRRRGFAEFHEVLEVETDDHGQLVAGVHGWSWGGTCWVEVTYIPDLGPDGQNSNLLGTATGGAGVLLVGQFAFTVP